MTKPASPNPDTSNTDKPLCFVIGPYGKEDSETREWSNFIFKQVVEPVVKKDFTVQRTLEDPQTGDIMDRIKCDLKKAQLVVADLTDANPNAYFELGYRHALDRPAIHLVRAKTVLPFDVSGFNTIQVPARYSEEDSAVVCSPDKLQEACEQLREMVDKINDQQPQPEPTEPISAKVYHWQMWYSDTIAVDWLDKQSDHFRQEIRSYEDGGGRAAVSERSLSLFAEYLALKAAANLGGNGTIFLTYNNDFETLDFGYAVFKFDTAAEPIPIRVTQVAYSEHGLSSISFEQPSRPYPVPRGSGTFEARIPGYDYTIDLRAENSSGTIYHPKSGTKIGTAKVTPKYGSSFA